MFANIGSCKIWINMIFLWTLILSRLIIQFPWWRHIFKIFYHKMNPRWIWTDFYWYMTMVWYQVFAEMGKHIWEQYILGDNMDICITIWQSGLYQELSGKGNIWIQACSRIPVNHNSRYQKRQYQDFLMLGYPSGQSVCQIAGIVDSVLLYYLSGRSVRKSVAMMDSLLHGYLV